MKKLLIGLSVLGSISSYSAEDARTFRNPSINGIAFSSDSNPSVVCNYLGYESAVSTYLKSQLTDAVVVTKDGVVGSDFATMNEFASVYIRVTCKNKLSNSLNLEIPSLLKNPSHPSLKKVLSRKSSENGVCKLLGFQKAAGGTLSKIIHPGNGLPIIDSAGKLVGEDYSSGSSIRKIICI